MHIFREGGNIKLDNNDFILKIVAELEQKGIKTGYDKLKKELEKDPAKIDIILNTSGTVGKTKGSIKKLAAELHNELSVEISKLQKQGQDINFDLSVGDVEEVVKNIINHTKELNQSFDVAKSKAEKFLAQFNKKSGGVLINSTEFQEVQKAIDGLGNTHSIEDLNKSMNTLEVTYNNIVSNLRNGGKSLNPFINAINDMKNMDSTLKGIELDYQSLASKPKDVANSIKELYNQQQKVSQYSQGTIEWSQEYGILQSKIVQVKNEIQNVAKAEKASNTDESNRVSYYQRIIDNNKTIYSLKNKLLTADQEQTTEIKRQIKALDERNRYNYNQLSKKGLSDNSWEQNVNSSKNALENQLRINEAKRNDIAHTREIAQAEKEAANAAKERQTIEAQVNKIQLSIGDKGDITTQIKTLSDNFTKLGLSADEVKSKMNGVDTELTELKSLLNSGASNSAIITQFDKTQSVLKETQNDLKATRSEYSLLVSAQQRLNKANTIEAWKQKHSAITKQAQADTQVYIDTLRNLNVQMTKMEFEQISRGFKETEISMRGLNKLGASLKDQFSQAAQSFTQWLSVSSGVMALVYQLQKIPKEVIKVNSAMVELNKVSDASDSEIKEYFNKAANSAKKYGSAVSDIINVTADWSRLGYNLPDSKKLAEVATLYKNVGDGIDIDTANESLVSTLQGFKLNADESMHIVDAFNEVGNNFAIGSDGIGEALKRSASSMYAAGNTLEETIGLVTAANEVVQDPDSIGTAYKTKFKRNCLYVQKCA